MQIAVITQAESESLFANQASHWQGQSIGRNGVLPITQALQTSYRNNIEADNQPWWVHRSQDSRQFTGLLYVQPDLSVFQGHFPDNPILPGVLQIDWAVHTTAEAFATLPASAFSGMSQIKFIQPIAPGSWLKLELTCNDTGAAFVYSNQQSACTKGRLHHHG